MSDDAVKKVIGVMSKQWDWQPTETDAPKWRTHAAWLVDAIRAGKPCADMDAYMSRVQALLKMHASMAFRKIVDRSIEEIKTSPTPAQADRVQKLNPTTA